MRTRFFLCLCLVLIFGGSAKADTLGLTGGFTATGNSGNFGFGFSGFNYDGTNYTTFSTTGFGISFMGLSVPRPFLEPAGGAINLSGRIHADGTDMFQASVVVNGVSSSVVNSLQLNVTSISVTVPISTAATLALSAPCTVNGSVGGGGVGAGFNGLCTATLNLNRGGFDSQGNGLYSFASMRYSFSAAPTPEPATMVLLGSGLLAASIVRRRRS